MWLGSNQKSLNHHHCGHLCQPRSINIAIGWTLTSWRTRQRTKSDDSVITNTKFYDIFIVAIWCDKGLIVDLGIVFRHLRHPKDAGLDLPERLQAKHRFLLVLHPHKLWRNKFAYRMSPLSQSQSNGEWVMIRKMTMKTWDGRDLLTELNCLTSCKVRIPGRNACQSFYIGFKSWNQSIFFDGDLCQGDGGLW